MDHHLHQKIKVEFKFLNSNKSSNHNNQMKLRKHRIFIGNNTNKLRRIPHFFMGRFKKWAKILKEDEVS